MAHGQAELLGVPKSWVLDQARRDAIPYRFGTPKSRRSTRSVPLVPDVAGAR